MGHARDFCGGAPSPEPITGREIAPAPEPRRLIIRRKVDLFLCKAAVILDGRQCAVLGGQGTETVIPVSQGSHTVSIRVASGAGIEELEEVAFQVSEHDWYGEFRLHRGIFRARYQFQIHEVLQESHP